MANSANSRQKYAAYRCQDGCWRPPRPEGLARILAKAGYGARTRAEAIVRSGSVTVNGKVVLEPGQAVDRQSQICLNGTALVEAPRRYLMLHKPSGFECQERRNDQRWVGRFYPPDSVGLELAGRLDIHAGGLLLVSNDLRWNTAVTEAANLERQFRLRVSGHVSSVTLDVILAGVSIANGGTFQPQRLELVGAGTDHTVLTVAVRGEHARTVRAAFTLLRHRVQSLTLTHLGPLSLDVLPSGKWRDLSAEEIGAFAQSS